LTQRRGHGNFDIHGCRHGLKPIIDPLLCLFLNAVAVVNWAVAVVNWAVAVVNSAVTVVGLDVAVVD